MYYRTGKIQAVANIHFANIACYVKACIIAFALKTGIFQSVLFIPGVRYVCDKVKTGVGGVYLTRYVGIVEPRKIGIDKPSVFVKIPRVQR